MSRSEELTALLRIDVDDIQDRIREYDPRTRFRLIRDTAEEYPTLEEPIDRIKAMWIVQATLACTDDRQLPYATSSEIAPRLASIVESKREERDARRSALDALALVFLKTKQLTVSLDETIRLAFMSAVKSRDPQMSEFAGEALSGEGVLAQRAPGRRVFFSFAQPVNRAHFQNVLAELRERVVARGHTVKRKVIPSSKLKPVSPKPSRRRVTREERPQKNVH